MDLLIYVIIMFASFLGLIIGVILSNIAIEEISHASVYLKYLNIIIVPTIILVATFKINIIYSIIFTSVAGILIVLVREKYNDAWTYSCMGALLYISTLSDETLNIAMLICIYGMSIATINANNHFKKKINEQIKFSENVSLIKKMLGKYSLFLIVGMMFYVTFSYIL